MSDTTCNQCQLPAHFFSIDHTGSSFSVGKQSRPPGVSILPPAHAINEHMNKELFRKGAIFSHSKDLTLPTEILVNQLSQCNA